MGGYNEVSPRYPKLTEIDVYTDALIVPGFIDCHVHYVQSPMIGSFGVGGDVAGGPLVGTSSAFLNGIMFIFGGILQNIPSALSMVTVQVSTACSSPMS